MPITDLVGGHTIGNAGVFIDTSRFVYGTGSGRFVAANSTYLTIPSDTDTTLNPYYQGNAPTSNSMTYEFWFYPSSTTQSCNLFSIVSPTSDGTGVGGYVLISLGNLTVTLTSFAGSAFTQTTSGTAINGWNHVALVWPTTGGVVLYLNGVFIGGLAFQTYHFFSQPIYLGWGGRLNGNYFDGWVDDVRYTPSARYSANFTPGYSPAAPQWVTANATTLATGGEGTVINATIQANSIDPQSTGILRYTIKSNPYSIPNLNVTNSGMVTGTLPAIGQQMSLVLDAVDSNGNYSGDRTFLFQSSIFSIPELKYSWRFDTSNTSVFYSPNLGSGTTTLNTGNAAYVAAPAPNAANNALLLTNSATMTMPASTNFEFLTSKNWTLEFWADLDAATLAANNTVLSLGQSTGNQGREFRVYQDTANSMSFGSTTALGSNAAVIGFGQPAAGWNHFAVVRTGNAISTFLNGALSNTNNNVATLGTTLYDNGTFTFNGLTGNANTSFNSIYLRGVNLFSLSKYSDPFTPVWNEYLQPVWESNAGSIYSAWEGNAIGNITLTAESFYGNTTPFTYSLTNSTSMPDGVTLTNNVVSGTVPPFSYTQAPQFFTLLATEANGATSPRSFFVNSVSTAPVWSNVTTLSPFISNVTISPMTLTTFDPKGLAVTYSLQSGSNLPGGLSLSSNGVISGNATQTTSDATYTFTVNAVNSAGKYSTQALSVLEYCTTDANYANTALLLHADGSFKDSSAANTTVSVVGNATISTTTFQWGNSSIFINNVSNSATPAGYISAPFTGITGDWTVEMWVNLPSLRLVNGNATEYLFTYCNGINPTDSFANNIFTCFLGAASVSAGIQYFGCRSYNTTNSQNGSDVGSNNIVGLLPLNTWNNVAVCRKGTTMYLFWNGVLVNTGTIPALSNIAGSFFFGVGGNAVEQLPFYGYMDDIRVTKGALYTANYTVQPYAYGSIAQPTPTFTTANTSLVLDSNTNVSYQLTANSIAAGTITYSVASGSLPPGLTLSANGLVTGLTPPISGNAVTYVANVAATLEGFSGITPVTYIVQPGDVLFGSVINMISPLPGYKTGILPADVQGHAVTAQGGGGLVSSAQTKWGTYNRNVVAAGPVGNFLYDAHSATMAGDFTVELWAYASSFPNSINILWSSYNGGGLPNINWMVTSGGAVMLNWGSGAPVDIVSANGVFPAGQWNHVAWCRQSGTSNVFVNGTLVLSGTNVTGTIGSTTSAWGLGGYQGSPSNYTWQGYLTDMRVTNGVARYTTNFTAPTLPFPQAIDDTPLWSTANTNLVLDAAEIETIQLSAPSAGGTVTYAIANGALPTGLTLNSNGLITGSTQALVQGANAVTSNATITATLNSTWQSNANVSYTVQPGDSFYGNVVTLIHAEDTANGTTLIDTSGKQTFALTSGGSVSTANKQFGQSSIYLPGANSATNIIQTGANPPGVYFGANDFTIEAWVYPITLQSTAIGSSQWRACIAALKGPGGAEVTDLAWTLELIGPTSTSISSINLECGNGSGGFIAESQVNIPVSMNTWHHIAVTRTGGALTFWLDGVGHADVGSPQLGGGTIISPATAHLTIGGMLYPGLSGNFNGYIDELRITNGNARYTTNFTPPALPFPNAPDQTPQWTNANTNLTLDSFAKQSYTLVAPSSAGTPAFSVANGALPTGLTLNSNGLVTGNTAALALGSNVVISNATIQANYLNMLANTNVSYTVQPDDPYFANVSTLIHAEDTPNGTTLADSTGKLTYSLNNAASVSTANKKFGSSSLYFPASTETNILQSQANPPGLAFSGDFTVEMWVNLSAFVIQNGTYAARLFSICNPTANNNASNGLNWTVSASNATTPTGLHITYLGTEIGSGATLNTTNFALNTWHHVALSRTSGTLYMFVDGNLLFSNASTTAFAVPSGATFQIGGLTFTNFNSSWFGYIDDVRVTNGNGRYTANFTVPQYSFPNTQDQTPVWNTSNNSLMLDSFANTAVLLTANTGANVVPTFSLTGGALPAGLTLASNGLVSGLTQGLAQGANVVVTNATITATSNANLTAVSNVTYIVQPDDLYYTNTVLLVHGDSGITDATGHFTVTQGGALTLTNSTVVAPAFKNSIAASNSTASYFTVPFGNATTFNLATNDFTMEGWFNQTSIPTGYSSNSAYLFSYGVANASLISQKPFGFFYGAADTLGPQFLVGRVITNGTTINDTLASGAMNIPARIPFNTWHHVAVSKQGNTFYTFYDGTLMNATVLPAIVTNSTYTLSIGQATGLPGGTGSQPPFVGFMDDLRVTVGKARYTSNFTVATYPFPSSQDQTPIWNTANNVLTLDSYANTSVLLTANTYANVVPAFSISNGALPTGLTLAANGLVSGVTQGLAQGANVVVSNATITAFMANNLAVASNVSYTVQPDDLYFTNTVALLHFEDAPGAVGLVESTGKNVFTANGGATTSTAQKKFGNSSMFLTGANGVVVQAATTTGLAFGTNDFTVEMWVYPLSLANQPCLLDLRPVGTSGFYPSVTVLTNGTMVWAVNNVVPITTTAAISINTWNHIAISRVSGTTRFFVNGTQSGSYTDSSNYLVGSHPTIGGQGYFSPAQYCLNGYVDEVRFTNGTGRYSANFTVAAYSFPNSQDRSQILFTAPVAESTTSTFANTISAYGNATVYTAFSSNYGTNYSVSAGSLPDGLTFNSNGVLSGVTNAVVNATASTFTVLANNPGGFSNTVSMTYNVAPVDPFANNVVLQVRAAQGLVDMTGFNTLSTVGSVALSNASAQNNDNTSIKFNGVGGTLTGVKTSVMTSAHANLGTQNYTAEMWINMIGLTLDSSESTFNCALFTINGSSYGSQAFSTVFTLYGSSTTTAPTTLIWRYYDSGGGGSTVPNQNPGGAISSTAFKVGQNIWQHVAFVRNGSTHTMYVDGVSQTVGTSTFSQGVGSSPVILLGGYNQGQPGFAYPYNGYMDDFRFTLGVARYTSNFTPPGALGR